jgi:hypothetical protein
MSNEWILPQNGILEFDYMQLIDRPKAEDIIPDDQLSLLVNWFKGKHDSDKIEAVALS